MAGMTGAGGTVSRRPTQGGAWSAKNRPKLDLSFSDEFAAQMMALARQRGETRDKQAAEQLRRANELADVAAANVEKRAFATETRAAGLADAPKLAQIQKDAAKSLWEAQQTATLEAANKKAYDEGRQNYNARLTYLKENYPDELPGLSTLTAQVDKNQTLPQAALPQIEKTIERREALRQKQAEKEQVNLDAEKKAAAQLRTRTMLLRQLKDPAMNKTVEEILADPNATAVAKNDALADVIDTYQKMATYQKTMRPAEPRAPQTITKVGPDGKLHIYGFNPQSGPQGEFNTDLGLAAAQGKEERDAAAQQKALNDRIESAIALHERENPDISAPWLSRNPKYNNATPEQRMAFDVDAITKDVTTDDKGDNTYGQIGSEIIRREVEQAYKNRGAGSQVPQAPVQQQTAEQAISSQAQPTLTPQQGMMPSSVEPSYLGTPGQQSMNIGGMYGGGAAAVQQPTQNPAIQAAIQAARTGDVAAQTALTARGIAWQ